ncbi:LAMI_0D07316g1_1 [Lachancea mirantina]|uniref:LAMI_0D07316g1_1 n=1 Tax=Lachancea mirantina TaxID=1230905 RepID=A0A1G4JCY4_9SACH|nr:LAMI_0D07316g1_1 [Lachancea mirantina]
MTSCQQIVASGKCCLILGLNFYPPKKTTSLADKKASILRFFQGEYSMYSMKELEKLIPKNCPGVSSMLVKDLVQQMIDEDGIITVEKCGNVNVYWCFESQIQMKLVQERDHLQQKLQDTTENIAATKQKLADDKKGLRSSVFSVQGKQKRRDTVLEELKDLDNKLKQLRANYDKVSQHKWNKDKIAKKTRDLSAAIRNLDTITDNIEIIVAFLCHEFSIDGNDLRTELNIPEEFKEFPELAPMNLVQDTNATARE